MIFAAEAEVRWLDHTEQRLAMHPQHAMTLELSTEKPKRGRPTLRQAQGPESGQGQGPDDVPSARATSGVAR
jgi:hypothetical protein